jgi:3-isopropylmalate/(R)-2-methylmalate dehydratase small subunit
MGVGMKDFGGQVLFLDRSDINTDEIIPAKYLVEIQKEAMKPHLLEDLKLEGFAPTSERFKNAKVLVTRSNFGCGSSREHAVWALETNDITAVVAVSYSRIFRQNVYNCGMLAIDLPEEEIERIFALQASDAEAVIECQIDIAKRELQFVSPQGKKESISFELGEFDSALIESGGWVEYADANY